MGTRGRYVNAMAQRYDGNEIIDFAAPCVFYDDFIGSKLKVITAGENTVATWTVIETADGVKPAILANASNGIADFLLASTNEAEDSIIYFGDQLPFNLNYGLIFECRACMHTAGTVATTKGIIGLASATAAPDSTATNLWFQTHGDDLKIYWEADDDVTNDDDNDSGVAWVADTYQTFRIDCTTSTAPLFYIDGVLVGTAATAFVTGTTALVQPYIGLYKSTGTDVPEMYVDYVKIWQRRS